MTQQVQCEKWFDGTFWTASVPDGWRFFQDRSIDGFPHVFASPCGARMQVGARKDVELSGYDVQALPEGLRTQGQRAAYAMTVQCARIDPGWSWWDFPRQLLSLVRTRAVRRHDVGTLTGFTYELRPRSGKGWAGFFSAQRWMLYVRFSAPKQAFDADSEAALLVLSSFRFQ